MPVTLEVSPRIAQHTPVSNRSHVSPRGGLPAGAQPHGAAPASGDPATAARAATHGSQAADGAAPMPPDSLEQGAKLKDPALKVLYPETWFNHDKASPEDRAKFHRKIALAATAGIGGYAALVAASVGINYAFSKAVVSNGIADGLRKAGPLQVVNVTPAALTS